MNSLIQSGAVSVIKDTAEPVYVIENSENFSLTGFKVIQNQDDFINCAKASLNGKVQLVYFTEGYKSLKQVIPAIDGDKLLKIFRSILKVIQAMKANGFLARQNLDMSLDRIFVDTASFNVKLIYQPVNDTETDADSFDLSLKRYFQKLIESLPALETPALKQFYDEISMQAIRTIEDLAICAEGADSNKSSTDSTIAPTKELIIKSMDPRSTGCTFRINSTGFIIGRKREDVDGVIDFNKAIGKTHCMIDMNDNAFSVIDLDSRNGTFVNGQRALSRQPLALSNGDVLKLADSEFSVEIK